MDDPLLAETVRLEGHGGDEIDAWAARPRRSEAVGGVVVIHHLPGFDRSSKEVVLRLAAAGYAAICPNLHHREAPGASSDDAAAASRAAGGVPDERLLGDVGAGVRWLRARTDADGLAPFNGRVGTIGFCSGGRQSFLSACHLPLDAAVVCYGAFVVSAAPSAMGVRMDPIVDQAGGISCPILGLFGNDDKNPPPSEVDELDRRLTELGKVHEFHRYDGAGHAFLDVDRPSYRPEAAKDAWSQIGAFLGRHLGS